MTVSTDVLAIAVAGLGALLAVALVAFAGHACWYAPHERRRRERLAALRAATRPLAAGQPLDGAGRAAIAKAPRELQLELLASLLPSVGGDVVEQLRRAVDRPRLLASAERSCGSRRWRRRLRGVRVLTLLGCGDAVVPPLLDDSRPEVSAAAVEWAAEHPSPATVDRLVALLGEASPFTRITVMDTLIRLGPAVVPQLADAIDDGAGPAALEVAARIGDVRLRPSARRRLSDPDPAVRAWAGRLLGALGDEQDAAATVALLSDDHADVRAAAAVALGRLRYWPAAGALGKRLRDPAWRVRRDAAHGLLALGPTGRLTLERALRDDDEFARDMARHALDLPESALPA